MCQATGACQNGVEGTSCSQNLTSEEQDLLFPMQIEAPDKVGEKGLDIYFTKVNKKKKKIRIS